MNQDTKHPLKPSSSHDRFLRGMMTNPKVIQEFFQENLPEFVKNLLDFSSITPQKESFVDESSMKLQLADLLYTARFQEEQGYLYLLVENSSAPSKLLPLRMWKYCLAIWDDHLKKHKGTKLPLIYPLIFYTGAKIYSYSTDFLALFGEKQALARQIFHNPFPLIDLTQVPDEHLLRYQHFGAMAFLAKHIRETDILPALRQILGVLRDLELQGETGYIKLMFSYLLEAGEVKDQGAFFEAINSTFHQGETIMTIAEQLRQEGEKRGFEKGEQRGFEKGRALAEQFRLEGEQKGKLETARKLLALEIPEEAILQATELSPQELINLKKERLSA